MSPCCGKKETSPSNMPQDPNPTNRPGTMTASSSRRSGSPKPKREDVVTAYDEPKQKRSFFSKKEKEMDPLAPKKGYVTQDQFQTLAQKQRELDYKLSSIQDNVGELKGLKDKNLRRVTDELGGLKLALFSMAKLVVNLQDELRETRRHVGLGDQGVTQQGASSWLSSLTGGGKTTSAVTGGTTAVGVDGSAPGETTKAPGDTSSPGGVGVGVPGAPDDGAQVVIETEEQELQRRIRQLGVPQKNVDIDGKNMEEVQMQIIINQVDFLERSFGVQRKDGYRRDVALQHVRGDVGGSLWADDGSS